MSVTSSTPGVAGVPAAIDSGIGLLASSERRLNRDAQQIASPGADPTQPLIDLLPARGQAQAAVEVIRASDAMLGTLLDIHA